MLRKEIVTMVEITDKYVDITTGEVIGYLVFNKGYKVALTENKMKDLIDKVRIEGLDYIDFLDIPIIESVVSGGKIYRCEDSVAEDSDIPDKLDGDKIWVQGYCFKKYNCTTLDNMYAIGKYLLDKNIKSLY